ncbi:MAG: hypothetical protein LYZ70_04105 [Nitrososphaerales archaeon]|nr:hypothetical protein [Nitrososphaerales archaeon]
MSEKDQDESIDSLKTKMTHPILREFADYLHADEKYSIGDMESLLLKEWDGAMPQDVLGDDVLVDLGNFLYNIGDFVVEKVIGDTLQEIGGHQLYVKTVTDPSYDSNSYIYVVESTTRSLLAEGCGCKTWNHDPDSIADDLTSLQAQLKSGWELVQRRVLTLNLLGGPTDLPLRDAEDK